jgi:hypothetical protein
MGFNKFAVTKSSELLTSLTDEYQSTSDQIYNCDETGISAVSKS